MNRHEHYMQLALDLAKKGLETVSPNPMVGCVIVKNEQIIGRGYHEYYGHPHAEPNAVTSVPNPKDIEEATIYVTLEPCSHYGKTPPCADLLVSLKPKTVIIASLDSNPLVAGKGIEKLQNAGIEVVTGVLEKEALELNKRFFCTMNKKRPYIFLKWAQTSDSFIGRENAMSLQISGKESMRLSHQLRATEDAILVGFTTAYNDNPNLNTRLVTGKNPLRLFIDKRLELPIAHHLLDQSTPTICFNAQKSEYLENLEYVQLEGEDYIGQILHFLHQRKINSLVVEGGARLLQRFIDANLWDEALVFESKMKIVSGIAAPKIRCQNIQKEQIQEDLLYRYSSSNN